MTDEQHDDKASMLAALKILAREKGDVARLKSQLSGKLGESAARVVTLSWRLLNYRQRASGLAN